MLRSKLRIILQSLKLYVAGGNLDKVSKVVEKVHPSDLALILNHLRISEANVVFDSFQDLDFTADVIGEINPGHAAEILGTWKIERIVTILKKMPSDDATRLLEEFDEDMRLSILDKMSDKESSDIEERFEYEEHTAARIMNAEFIALDPTTTVEEATRYLRGKRDIEVIYYLYVLGPSGQLTGVASMRDLLLADAEKSIGDIMTTDTIWVRADDDQEAVAIKVAQYNLLAIPVLDDQNRMMGIVTVDDVIDVIKDEATEDMLKMAGTAGSDLVTQSIFTNVKIRWPWLLASWFGGMCAFYITGQFEQELAKVVILAGFIPIVLGMGGNVGTQSSTLVVRGLAMNLIDSSSTWRVLTRETRIGVTLGLGYGGLLGLAVLLLSYTGIMDFGQSPYSFAMVVAFGVLVSMFIASVIGSSIPLLLDRIRVDPAIATGPLVTTSVDILGVLAFLSVATLLLKL